MHWLPADRNLRARKDDATTTCTEIAGTTDLRVESIYDFVRSSEVSYFMGQFDAHQLCPTKCLWLLSFITCAIENHDGSAELD